jgi:hypothetical protein
MGDPILETRRLASLQKILPMEVANEKGGFGKVEPPDERIPKEPGTAMVVQSGSRVGGWSGGGVGKCFKMIISSLWAVSSVG